MRVLQREVAVMTGWVVVWIVACPHLRAACKIAVTDVLTRGHSSMDVPGAG